MAQEKLTYQEALKALKAQYAEERKAERFEKRAQAKQGKRNETAEVCKKALEVLQGIDPAFNRELAPVVTRLQMFVDGKKYTRSVKGE